MVAAVAVEHRIQEREGMAVYLYLVETVALEEQTVVLLSRALLRQAEAVEPKTEILVLVPRVRYA